MSLSLTQFTRSLKVYASNYDIPSPYVLAQGAQDSNPFFEAGLGYSLYSTAAKFVKNKVSVGDILYVYDGNTFLFVTVVTGIQDEETIFTNDSISSLYNFIVYQQSEQSGLGNQGCFLMSVNDSVTIDVETLTGNTITGIILNSNDVLPIQVRKLLTSTNGNAIYALW